jgi:MOSC domain-containing protein YiiM
MSEARVADLEGGLAHVVAAPRDSGTIEMIVRRPSEDEREIVATAEIGPGRGLVGDNWGTRSRHPNPDAEITLMNARSAALVAGDRDRWPLAGDQIYVDLDLSEANLPTGTRLRVGDAVVEVSGTPHTGCSKFAARFGTDALRFVNQGPGKTLRLRGLNTRVVQGGALRVGDLVTKIQREAHA